VNDVDGDEVILHAGCLQNLIPGEYSVFEATVTEAGVDLGKESCDWLGTVKVTEGRIGQIEASGLILERKPDTEEKFRVSEEHISFTYNVLRTCLTSK
jgi:hypothetical protein